MALTFEVDPAFDRPLRDGITALWADVTNAGGAVGFVAPVTADDVRPELVKHLAAMAEGRTHLVVGRDEDGEVAATAFLTHNTHRLMRHWIGVYTVMVHPRHQGRGYGRELMAAVADAARGSTASAPSASPAGAAPAPTGSTPPAGTRRWAGSRTPSGSPRTTTATTSSCCSRSPGSGGPEALRTSSPTAAANPAN